MTFASLSLQQRIHHGWRTLETPLSDRPTLEIALFRVLAAAETEDRC